MKLGLTNMIIMIICSAKKIGEQCKVVLSLPEQKKVILCTGSALQFNTQKKMNVTILTDKSAKAKAAAINYKGLTIFVPFILDTAYLQNRIKAAKAALLSGNYQNYISL